MAFINFVETFFFISLGITFILILLLVHHFKQRIVSLEQKYDTTFEIINNIVKEMGNIRNMQFNVPQYSFFPKTNVSDMIFSPNVSDAEKNDEKIVNMIIKENDNDEDIDDSDDENEDEDDYDIDDENEEDDDSDDENEEDDDSDEPIVNIVDQDNYPSIIKINMDTIDINENIILNHTVENNIELQEENIKVINIENQEVSSTEFQNEINPENIHIEKKDTSENDLYQNDIHSIQTHVEEESNQSVDNSKDVYKKMNLQTLKTLVITKGLSTDPSRMKKPELIKLLESLN
jgi:hypothetical protein